MSSSRPFSTEGMIAKKLARLASRSLDATDRIRITGTTEFPEDLKHLMQIIVSNQCQLLDLSDRMEQAIKSSSGLSSAEEIPRPSRYRGKPGGSRADALAESDSAGEEYTFETMSKKSSCSEENPKFPLHE